MAKSKLFKFFFDIKQFKFNVSECIIKNNDNRCSPSSPTFFSLSCTSKTAHLCLWFTNKKFCNSSKFIDINSWILILCCVSLCNATCNLLRSRWDLCNVNIKKSPPIKHPRFLQAASTGKKNSYLGNKLQLQR